MTEPNNSRILRIAGADLLSATGQTDGALRLAGVCTDIGASAIWMGRVKNDPGTWSDAHHHGEAETAGFLILGRARIYFGEDYREWVDVEPGDFVHVPPFVPHIEGNVSETEPMEWLTARTPDNIVVNLGLAGRPVHERALAEAAAR